MSVRVRPQKVSEIRDSCREILKLVQSECFLKEIESLQGSTELSEKMSNSLSKLNPILQDELLCVGGRLHWSDLADSVKHPVILPAKHFVTDLIIRHYHEMEGHIGCTQVLATIRKRCWILKGRSAV